MRNAHFLAAAFLAAGFLAPFLATGFLAAFLETFLGATFLGAAAFLETICLVAFAKGES